jgi:aryl-alcohol dehydrogenase-like predicted oxidoreductase
MTKKRRLGKTDIEITRIGLGCWQFSQGSKGMSAVWDAVDQETINGIVGAAISGGISWFDTAELYGRGTSEQTLAKALTAAGARPGQVVIATKWWPFARRARSIETTIDTRLSCLSPFPIDLYQVHQPFSVSPVAAQMKAMARILKAGKIRAVGVSNFSTRRMELAHAALASEGIVLASNQMRFNLLDRSIERNGVLDAAKKLGVTIIAYSPLAQGVLTGRFHEDPGAGRKVSTMRRMLNGFSPARLTQSAPLIDEMRAIGRAHGASVAQVALCWETSFHGETIVAIPGATKKSQAEQSAGAMSFQLSSTELTRIDALSRAVR